MKNKSIGFAVTGSFCTFGTVIPVITELAKENNVIPILSYSASKTDTRFYKSKDFIRDLKDITKNNPITNIVGAEPIGPKKLFDAVVIAPATGNTLAKLAASITDTPVLMAAKAHLRNNRPLLIAVSSNDALSGNAKNIGALMSVRNIFFVPMSQDDPVNKDRSLIADFSLLIPALEKALELKQIQPIYK